MSHSRASIGADYFEQLYRSDPDPWGFASKPYEQAKYDHTLRALDDRYYGRGLEVGCAIGVLTKRLARIVGTLVAVDVSNTALSLARARCADLSNVTFESSAFPRAFIPSDPFDLIVLSEVAYYWSDADIASAGRALGEIASSGCDLLLVHWIGETNYPQSGDDAVNKLRASLNDRVRVLQSERTAAYRLDRWRFL